LEREIWLVFQAKKGKSYDGRCHPYIVFVEHVGRKDRPISGLSRYLFFPGRKTACSPERTGIRMGSLFLMWGVV